MPYEDSPEYRANPPHRSSPGPRKAALPPRSPAAVGPAGIPRRKLAELDQQYSNGEISMEEYMTRRNDITNG